MNSGGPARRRDAVEALEARTLFTTPPPTVVDAFVAGSEWSQPFKDYLAANVAYSSAEHGLNVRERYGQWGYLPWVNLDRISISVNTRITADQADLTVRGVNVPQYPVVGFEYSFDPDTYRGTATWVLGRPLGNDRVLARLDVDGPNGVRREGTDAKIDGDGDLRAGGDYLLRLNVLPGDVDLAGINTQNDLRLVRRMLTASIDDPGSGPGSYAEWGDLDGSGRIDVLDVAHVRRRLIDRLPAAQTAAGTEALVDSSTSVFGTRRIRPDVRALLAGT